MLNVSKINAAKPSSKDYKLFDGSGLFLFVSTSGGKLWRMKYRFGGLEKLLSFGAYPIVSLLEAREKRDTARKQIKQGIDPGNIKKAQKKSETAQDSRTFEVVSREWHKKFYKTWKPRYAQEILDRLERDIFPWIGHVPISALALNPLKSAIVNLDNYKLPLLVDTLRRIESRGALESVRKAKIICGQVFRYGVASGDVERNPIPDLKGAFSRNPKKHFAAITDPNEVGPLLISIDNYKGTFIVKCGFRLAPLLIVRPGELRTMEWAEINIDEALWTIPAEKMKMEIDHCVPLSRQAVMILIELKPLTGNGKYVMPSRRSYHNPMSENTILAAIRTLGYSKDDMTGHGFRAMARTIMDEVLHIRVEYIEHQLAHTVKDTNGRAYNRTTHLKERREMMQIWADYLDGLRTDMTPCTQHSNLNLYYTSPKGISLSTNNENKSGENKIIKPWVLP